MQSVVIKSGGIPCYKMRGRPLRHHCCCQSCLPPLHNHVWDWDSFSLFFLSLRTRNLLYLKNSKKLSRCWTFHPILYSAFLQHTYCISIAVFLNQWYGYHQWPLWYRCRVPPYQRYGYLRWCLVVLTGPLANSAQKNDQEYNKHTMRTKTQGYNSHRRHIRQSSKACTQKCPSIHPGLLTDGLRVASGIPNQMLLVMISSSVTSGSTSKMLW